MACPFFCPTIKADRPQPARTPLGALFDGECHASTEPRSPDESRRYETCNFGYGRGVCGFFPEAADADAVRFTAVAGKLLYVYEREHSPVRYGEADLGAAGVLGSQVRAFGSASGFWKAAR